MNNFIHKRLLSLILCACMLFTCLPVFTAAAAEGDEFDAMREKFYSMAVGGDYDPNDPQYAPMLKSINDTAQKYWDSMNKNPVCNTANGQYTGMAASAYANDWIFPEYPLGLRDGEDSYDCSNSLQFTFQYLRAMALAYQTKGCALYQNKDMLNDILSAVDYVCEYHFNTKLAGYGNQGYGNWFAWQIGAPIYLGETLMLLYDEFTAQEIQEYATVMIHFLANRTMTGANGTWTERVRMYAGILLKDASWLNFVKDRMPALLSYTTAGDGYYLDGTFVQHNNITYNGGYGLMILTDSVFIENILAGTQWALDKSSTDIIYQFVYDTYVPAVYEGMMMDVFRGREITRKDTTQPRGGILVANAMLMLAENAPADIAADFRGMVKQWFDSDFMMNELFNSADTPWYKFPMDTAVKIVKLKADDSVEPYDFSGTNVQMVSGARAVHFADDFAFSISMANKRIATYETGDSNAKGWYTGNGMTQLFLNNDPGRFEGVNKATIDWNRLPGTTEVYGKEQGALQYNNNNFTGGVTDGTYGVTGMDMSFNPNALKAKKSWFMFDDEVVALGSNISGNGDIETVIENLMLDSDNRSYSVNGEKKAITLNGAETVYNGVETLHIEGNNPGSDIGVYFPGNSNVSVKSETRTGKWSDLGFYNTDETVYTADYLTAWFEHGNNATNGSYAYVLLPGMTAAQTASYAKGSDIEILQQDANIHAVYEKTTGTLGACFWAGAGSLALGDSAKYLSVDNHCAVMVSEGESGIRISLSDPTMEYNGDIIVELDRAVMGAEQLDEGVELLQTSPTTKVKFSLAGVVGESLNAKLSFDIVTPPEDAEPTTTINLARGKAASSSANDPNSTVLTPDKAVDGDASSRWASGRTNDQWFVVDLGQTCTVEAVNILWEAAAGKEYKIQISDDSNTWTDMVHEDANTGAGWKRYTLSQSYTGRYVRMLGISRTTNYGYSMYEFEVMGITGVGSSAPITAIKLPDTMTMVQGERVNMTATITPANTLAAIGWKSSNEDLLKVNGAGTAVAMASSGEVTLTAYALADESIKAECKVTLKPNDAMPVAVTGITISAASNTAILPGDTCRLTAVVAPANATYTAVKWSSSDESVAIVNADGVVTAIGEGRAVITAQSVTSSHSASRNITVGNMPLPGDADLNGEVTVADLTELKNLILSNSWSSEQLAACDLNSNNRLDVSDIIAVKRIILGG